MPVRKVWRTFPSGLPEVRGRTRPPQFPQGEVTTTESKLKTAPEVFSRDTTMRLGGMKPDAENWRTPSTNHDAFPAASKVKSNPCQPAESPSGGEGAPPIVSVSVPLSPSIAA